MNTHTLTQGPNLNVFVLNIRKARQEELEMKTKVPYKRRAECMAHSYVYCCVGIREKINYSTNNQNEMILFASKVK